MDSLLLCLCLGPSLRVVGSGSVPRAAYVGASLVPAAVGRAGAWVGHVFLPVYQMMDVRVVSTWPPVDNAL